MNRAQAEGRVKKIKSRKEGPSAIKVNQTPERIVTVKANIQ